MSHFVIGEISIGKGADPLPPPLGYAYVPSEENKKGVRKISARFLAFSNEISTVQKIVLSSSRGQANFRGLEASRPRPRPRTWPSRPRPRPRTSKCVLEDVLEAKDVLEDSTSEPYNRLLWPTNIFSYCRFGVWAGEIFVWGAPPLVASPELWPCRNRLKTLSAAVNAAQRATRILLERWSKNYFCHKNCLI